MTKKSRTILFLAFASLFLITAPFFALYSQGYRFDFDKKRITQTGGLFFKISPKQAEIYVNNDLVKKTDFFFGSTLIENLLPKPYKIEIKKDGFKSWTKILEIKEKEVTSAKNVVLFSENYPFDTTTKNVENFWIFPDQKKLILKEKEKNGWSLKLYDPNKNLTSLILEQGDISAKNPDLTDLEFSLDLKEIYLKIELGEQIRYYLVSPDKTHSPLSQKNPPLFWNDNILDYQISDNMVFYIDNSGDIYKSDSASLLKEKLTEKPFKVKPETKYGIKVFGNRLFLMEEKTLYRYDQEKKSFEKIADSATDLKLSPDGKKIAYFNDNEVWVLFLEDIEDQPTKKNGDKVLLARFSEKIENVFWLNAHYVVFDSGSQIKVSEIDDRDNINSIDLISKQNPKIFWDQNNKQLYILSEGILYQSEKLIQ